MITKEVGNYGENVACDFLEKQGISVLKRNFHSRFGEIDIIAKDGETIVFVEVKTRATKSFGAPSEFVDERKQKKIIQTALYFLGNDDCDMRFDVIEIMYAQSGDSLNTTEINHIKSAF